MDFSDAFNRMKHGRKKVTRPSLNGAFLAMGTPAIMLCTVDETNAVVWHPLPEDLMAEDWELHFGNS